MTSKIDWSNGSYIHRFRCQMSFNRDSSAPPPKMYIKGVNAASVWLFSFIKDVDEAFL
jgi:uncharacterized C2H2 Zn-finger protein